jgi:hypothetical protein
MTKEKRATIIQYVFLALLVVTVSLSVIGLLMNKSVRTRMESFDSNISEFAEANKRVTFSEISRARREVLELVIKNDDEILALGKENIVIKEENAKLRKDVDRIIGCLNEAEIEEIVEAFDVSVTPIEIENEVEETPKRSLWKKVIIFWKK